MLFQDHLDFESLKMHLKSYIINKYKCTIGLVYL